MFTREWLERNLKLLTNHDRNVLLRKVGKYSWDIYILNKQQSIGIYNHIEKLKKQWYFNEVYRKKIKADYYKEIRDFTPIEKERWIPFKKSLFINKKSY